MQRAGVHRLLIVTVVILAVQPACESASGPTPPSAPPPPGPPPPPPGPPTPRVLAGDTISGSVASGASKVYAFDSPASEYAMFFEATTGGGSVFVRDSITNTQLAFVSDVAGGPGLATQVSTNFRHAGTLLLEVFGVAPDTTRYRFYIYPVNRSPESRAARFTIGDTVSGESIDAIPDVDDFVAAGRAGQYLAGWIEPLGPPTANTLLYMDVVDSSSNGLMINRTFGVIGQTPRSLFSAGPHGSAADYRFTVPAPRGSNVQYTGPYRFYAYEIDPKPESANGSLAANSVVSEAMDIGGDIDDFTLPVTAGSEFNLFVQSSAVRPVTASVVTSIQGGGVASAGSTAADTGMFEHATGRFKVLADTTLWIRVRGQLVSDAVGAYRLYLYRINRAPESLPGVVTPGDTISGESIDLPGDIDEFTFSGTVGQQFNIFVQTAVQGPQGISMTLRDPDNQVLKTAQSFGPASDLLLQSTGRVALPKTGTYRLTFDGVAGPYRFFIYPINPQPETHAAAIAFRDSVENESIDVPGDIDEFTFSVTQSTGAALFYEANAAIEVSITNSGTGTQTPIDSYYRTFTVSPGSYILRFQSPADPGVGVGSYRVWMYPSQPTPETRSENVAIGDTIDGEQIDPPADVDVFYFNGTKGQHVNFALQGTSAPTANAGYTALLYQPNNLMGWVSTPTSSPSLGSQQTTRLDLPATGRYMIRIQGGSSPTQRVEHGPYRFALTAVDTLPEHTGTAVVPGDSVTNERIDTPGDLDQFTLSGTAGEELGLVFQSSGTNAFPLIVASNPLTGDSLARTVGQFVRFAGPFRVPTGGQARIEVFEPASHFYECYDATCGNVYRFIGSYRFSVIHVNRAPESASATYVIGDTARDSIGVGDIDEFNATAPAGTVLTAYLRLTAPPVNSGNGAGLTLEIINPVTGDTLAGKGWQIFGQTQLYPVGSFSVPAGGHFLIRVRGSGTFGDDIITAPYEMQVKP